MVSDSAWAFLNRSTGLRQSYALHLLHGGFLPADSLDCTAEGSHGRLDICFLC